MKGPDCECPHSSPCAWNLTFLCRGPARRGDRSSNSARHEHICILHTTTTAHTGPLTPHTGEPRHGRGVTGTGGCSGNLVLVFLQAILAFCWFYIRKYQSRQESEVVSTITAICALAIALITSALLPVDIFLVSFMKYPNGTYKVSSLFTVALCIY